MAAYFDYPFLGTEVQATILKEIEEEEKKIKQERGVVPGLASILVGENPASAQSTHRTR
jgi:5,10-methylene-tetrahydrofolate dehydrogenase/methenyl tetrahydrofolate cyclohydrolase